jgi:hypothetical protein
MGDPDFVIGAGVTLGVAWLFGGALPGAALLTTCTEEAGSCAMGASLIVPGIGPFIAMVPLTVWRRGRGDFVAPTYAMLAIDGVVQSTLAALFFYGLVGKKDVPLRKRGEDSIHWVPTPMRLGGSGHGLGVVGTF